MAVKKAVFLKGFDFGTPVEDIEAHCATVGKVISIELKGKGGALVTYGSEVVAKKAADQLQHSIIEGNTRYIDVNLKAAPGAGEAATNSSKGNGKSGKVKAAAQMALPAPWSQPMKPIRPSQAPKTMQTFTQGGAGNPVAVTVRGFDFGTTEADVRKHFARVGKVLSVELTGKGSAAVTFTSPVAAQKAVAQLDKSVMAGNERYIDVKTRGGGNPQMAQVPLFVPTWIPAAIKGGATSGTKQNGGQAGSAVVKVQGFDFGTSEEAVKKHCAKVGKVLSVELKGANGGSAWVTFSSPKAAEKAVQQLNQSVIDGNTRYIEVKHKAGNNQQTGSNNVGVATVQPSKKRKAAPATDGCSILVRGYDKGTTIESIVDHCAAVGEITKSTISKKNAILTYGSAEEAQAAVEGLDKSIIDGNSRYIDVKIDEGKPDAPHAEGGPRKMAKVAEKKEKGPSGPNLARELVDEIGTITGAVARSVKGKSGFIKPHEPIDHPEAGKHKGDIYFHSQDVLGDELLEKGAEVQFAVYVDASGLGAQDISLL